LNKVLHLANKFVQIEESLLRGKKKYNRGRILLGDLRSANLKDDNTSNSDSGSENISLITGIGIMANKKKDLGFL